MAEVFLQLEQSEWFAALSNVKQANVRAVAAGELGRRPAEKVLNTVEVSGRGPRTPHPHREARAARG